MQTKPFCVAAALAAYLAYGSRGYATSYEFTTLNDPLTYGNQGQALGINDVHQIVGPYP